MTSKAGRSISTTDGRELGVAVAAAIWDRMASACLLDASDPALCPDVVDVVTARHLSAEVLGRDPRVALVSSDGFERFENLTSAGSAYARLPRTKVYESLHVQPGTWSTAAATVLSQFSERDVAVTAYASHAGDDTMGPHIDAWDGFVVQLAGSKDWWLDDHEAIRLEAGDGLFIPCGVVHDVRTTVESLHAGFAFLDSDVTQTYLRDSTDAPRD
jgi:ribosomal protein L16 Arg81 hydroxylase